jgi:hypothetical protein
MKNALKYAAKAFFGGCFGCLGAWSVSLVMLVVVGLLGARLLGPPLQGMINGLAQGSGILPMLVGGFSGGLPTGISEGMLGVDPGQMQDMSGDTYGWGTSGQATPTGELPRLDMWITLDENPDGQRTAEVTSAETSQLTLWLQGPPGAREAFQVWITFPEGTRMPFGPGFATNPEGTPVDCGGVETPLEAGSWRFEAVMGSTTVGSTDLVVTP